MDGNVYDVAVLVNDSDDLLIVVARRHTHQSGKLADTKIHVNDIVARLHLLQFLHGEGHLAATRQIRFKVVLMKTVENLMIGEEAYPKFVVGKALVKGLANGCKGYTLCCHGRERGTSVGV